MARADILDMLYRRMSNKKVLEFENIPAPPPLRYFFLEEDMEELRRIATSNKLAAKPKIKYDAIDKIMRSRNFRKMASGTNRVVYKYLENQSFVTKIAIDSVGMKDNPREQYNQILLKPFCTKIFDTHQSGVIGQAERIQPILSREEFISIAPDIYSIITGHFIGNHVIDDFGSDYYQNWGVRVGAHPVICDFPYVFKLDPAKLVCNAKDIYSKYGICGGEIDYDDGFNKLICTKCGKPYNGEDLKVPQFETKSGILITGEGDIDMELNVKIVKGDKVIQEVNSNSTSIYVKPKTRYDKKTGNVITKKTPYEYREEKRIPNINVHIVKGEADSCSATTLVATLIGKADKEESKKPDIRAYVEKVPTEDKFNKNTTVKDQPSISKEIGTVENEEYKEEKKMDEKLVQESIDDLAGKCVAYTEADTLDGAVEFIGYDDEDDEEESDIVDDPKESDESVMQEF